MWVTPATEIPKTNQEPTGTPDNQEDFKARHKEAQDALSRKAEENIKTNVKLAKLDPKEISSMELKMQNKVISELYWYGNIEELKTMQGEEFWKSWEDQDLSDHEELAKKIKLLEYQNKKADISRAIDSFQKDNKKVFEDDEEAATKLEAELSYISDTLPAEERVKRAGRILFGDNYVDKTTQAYLSMQDSSFSTGNKTVATQEKNTSFADYAKSKGFLK